MERMWSPWRSQHIAEFEERHRPSGDGTVFERIAARPDDDDEHLVVWRGRLVFVVMNLYPYNNGHLLIVPYRRVERYVDLTPDEQQEIASVISRSMRWLERALGPEGFNVGINEGRAGGAGIPEHLHVHLVPRWSGDTNFMPVTGSVKLIPEALRETFEKLREAVNADDAGHAARMPPDTV